jgi:decaprenylphospho-beta-D-erythro-pentofuranosid-2-ulose 2-reductase
VDLVISAVGVLTPQVRLEADPGEAAALVEANLTRHVTALLAVAAELRPGPVAEPSSSCRRLLRCGRGGRTASTGRPRLASTRSAKGWRLVARVRGPGAAGAPRLRRGPDDGGHAPAPLSSTPEQVGAAVVTGLARPASVVWVPPAMRVLAGLVRVVPRPLWRRLRS